MNLVNDVNTLLLFTAEKKGRERERQNDRHTNRQNDRQRILRRFMFVFRRNDLV